LQEPAVDMPNNPTICEHIWGSRCLMYWDNLSAVKRKMHKNNEGAEQVYTKSNWYLCYWVLNTSPITACSTHDPSFHS
jgi:hypothetical protein